MSCSTAVCSPWPELNRLQHELNRWFESGSRAIRGRPAGSPPINLWQGPQGLVLTAEIPGVALGDLEIELLGGTVVLRGPRPTAGGDTSERFERSVRLPYVVDANTAAATYERGILTLKLSQPAAMQPRKVVVQAG